MNNNKKNKNSIKKVKIFHWFPQFIKVSGAKLKIG